MDAIQIIYFLLSSCFSISMGLAYYHCLAKPEIKSKTGWLRTVVMIDSSISIVVAGLIAALFWPPLVVYVCYSEVEELIRKIDQRSEEEQEETDLDED